jgi:hypothetical protein
MAEVTFSAVIMAHPARERAAGQLRDRYPELGARIVYDPDPDGPRSTLRTARLAWGAIAPGASHHLVLQDDVALCDDFPAQLARAVATMPDRPLFLYTDWGTPCSQLLRLAALRGASWAEAIDPYVPAQAVLLPAGVARRLVDYVDGHPELEPDDAMALRLFLEHHDLTAYVCVPNLVQHAGLPSLLSHDVMMGERRSVCFGNDPRHPVPWTDAALSGVGMVPDFVAGRSVCWLRDPAAPSGLRATGAYDWLRGRGLALPELTADFLAAVEAVGPLPVSRGLLADAVLFQLWLTGLLYGVAMATWKEFSAQRLADAVLRPLAARCLGSLVGGGVREILAVDRIAPVSAELTPLFVHALHHGVRLNAGRGLLDTL